MLKGKILKFSGSEAIVLSDTLKYEKIKLKPQMEIGQTIYYFEEDLIENTVEQSTSFMEKLSSFKLAYRLAPVLAVLVIAIMIFGNSPQPYAIVSIDINPSISLHLNEEGLIEDVEGKNEDGENLLATIDLTNASLQEALEIIITASKTSGYLEDDGQIFIATAEKNNNHEIINAVEDILETSDVDDPYNIYITETNYENYESAENENVSLGHYILDIATDVDESELFDATTIESIPSTSKTITKRDAKEYKEKVEEKKEEIEEKKEDIKEKQEERKEQIEEKKEDIKEKQEERKEQIEKKKDDIKEKQEERKVEIEEKKDDVKEKQEERKEQIEEKKEDIKEKQEERKEQIEEKKEDIKEKQKERKVEKTS